MTIKRAWDLSTAETKRKCMDQIITRLEEAEGEAPGIILAGDLLDIVVQAIGPDIYNNGIKDTQALLATRFADIEIDLDLLKQS